MAFTRLSVISRSSLFIQKRTMSSHFFPNVIDKLASPVKELVEAVSENGQKFTGETEADQKEVIDWITQSSEIVTEGRLKELNAVLLPRTYIATSYFTAADAAFYGYLHPVMSQLEPTQWYSIPCVSRYLDHIQNQESIRIGAAPFAPAFEFIRFDFEDAPAIERRREKREKRIVDTPSLDSVPPALAAPVPSSVPSTPGPTVIDAPAPESSFQERVQKKEKKKDAREEGEKKRKGGKEEEIGGEPVPSMIDLRVGHIVDVVKHPDADGLYIEQIDLGEETGPRTVVSGLVNYVPIEQMRDRSVVVVCNLKPANMRGVKSFAMVFCATCKDGKEGGIELIQPPPGSKPGERVYFEGPEFENATPLSQLNPKKKIFETVQSGFVTLETKEAAWINPVTKSVHKIRTKDGICVAPTLVGASLS
ncbi:G4 quadruplex nucleic acid binding protein [Leucoagaricus gongylophorus]